MAVRPRGSGYARARRAGHWHTLTLLGAITSDGLLATMTIESPTDSAVFLAYLEQVLCPRLRPGQVVVMDNLSAHKHPAVRQFDRAGWGGVALPAALLPRLQSHRAVLGQDQGGFAGRENPGGRSAGEGRGDSDRRRYASQRHRLVSPLWVFIIGYSYPRTALGTVNTNS